MRRIWISSARNCRWGSGRAGRFEGTGARLVAARAKILGKYKEGAKSMGLTAHAPSGSATLFFLAPFSILASTR